MSNLLDRMNDALGESPSEFQLATFDVINRILSKMFESEFEVVEGYMRHPDLINFSEWLDCNFPDRDRREQDMTSYAGHDHGLVSFADPVIDLNAYAETMGEDVPHQSLIDTLSHLAITSKIDFEAAKRAVEDGDWEEGKRLIREAAQE